MKTLIVFHGEGKHPLMWLLKKGFKHTFVCIDDGTFWISIERVRSGSEIKVVCGSDYDLAGFYRDHDFTVVERDYEGDKTFPMESTNCVGLTKTIAGVRNFSFTPWQLYKRLR